jgi:hypothetical protein
MECELAKNFFATDSRGLARIKSREFATPEDGAFPTCGPPYLDQKKEQIVST